MKGYFVNIKAVTTENSNFRKVMYTSKRSQLVIMNLIPGEEIGTEIHIANDQFFCIEHGSGVCMINGQTYKLREGDIIIVPAGAKHNITNTSKTDSLKFYTIYSPAHHKDGLVQKTKKESTVNSMIFDGVTTE